MSEVDRLPRQTRVDAATPAATRDDDLDVYRGLALIWVVWIHCVYLSGVLGPNWDVPKSWMLIEMPVLFFVSGAAASLGRPQPALWGFVGRLARILVPYWAFALVCLGLEYAIGDGLARMNETYLLAWALPLVTPPGSNAIAPLHWPLWFIPVYLGVFAVFPLLQTAHRALPRWGRFAPLVGLAALVYLAERLTGFDVTRHVLIYSFWAYLGLFYTSFKARPWPRPAVLAASLAAYAVLAVLILRGYYPPNMQASKFPPRIAFLFLGLGHFGLLAVCHKPILRAARSAPLRWLVRPYQRYGYTVYLYHSVVFLAWYRLRAASPTVQWFTAKHPRLTILLLTPAVLLLVPLVARPFAALERFRLRLPDSEPSRRDVGAPHVRVPSPSGETTTAR
jgi:peptidoglycan/LPS O-acetylase OafA/YrhL